MISLHIPDQIYGELFEDIQKSAIFKDSKVFVDAIANRKPTDILQDYQQQKQQSNFNLANFIANNFELPKQHEPKKNTEQTTQPLRNYISDTWQRLKRSDKPHTSNSSLITLPKPYVVPGGRFREVYYWDSYFTMLGLTEDGEIDIVRNMVDNFAFLIDQFGFIPNANRSYYCTRSQPPFFAMMVELLTSKSNKKKVYQTYISQLQKEYDFWMSGKQEQSIDNIAHRRLVKYDNALLNRYWDDSNLPRAESYAEDLHIAGSSNRNAEEVYRDIRAAAESGYDFSSRWFSNQHSLETINTTKIIPIDLNCLMYKLESTLAEAYSILEKPKESDYFNQCANNRKELIQSLFFNKSTGYFCDLMLPDLKQSRVHSLAGCYPLFFDIASQAQAEKAADYLEKNLLKSAGWVETNNYTHQQWDAPNGWAPSQWVTAQGLINYGYQTQAQQGMRNWVKNVDAVYQEHGILLEKYNVEEPGKFGDGGEYQVQHGFGWTNAVTLCFMNKLGL